MSFTVDKLEKNMVKLTIEVDAEEFAKGMEAAYEKNKNKISVPGFRKGKVPKQMIEKMYGAGIFMRMQLMLSFLRSIREQQLRVVLISYHSLRLM